MNNEAAHDVLWRRLKYTLSPQWDIYASLRGRFKAQTVLEVGFGTGAGVLQYSPWAIHVDAMEVDPGAVAFAKEVFPIPNVNWMVGDITSYKTHKHYMNILMIETLEHIHDWQKALKNVTKLLDDGGAFIITARNANADLRRYKELHEREWAAREFHGALEQFFHKIWFFDYSLSKSQGFDTTLTPIVAVCKEPR